MSFYQRQHILAENTVLSDYGISCLINEMVRQDSIRLTKQAANLNGTVFWKRNIFLIYWWLSLF